MIRKILILPLGLILFFPLLSLFSCKPVDVPVGEIHVTTEPPGARICIDGKEAGLSPLTVNSLSEGAYLIEAESKGFRTARDTLLLFEHQKASMNLRLEPLQGLLLIHSIPPDVDVQMDGESMGKTPLLLHDVPLGPHRIEFNKEPYFPRTVDVSVADQRPKKIEVLLDSNFATIQFQSTPPGAQVLVNGIQRGVTPCTVAGIPTGAGRISLMLPGYYPHEEALNLYAGQMLSVEPVLRAQPGTLSVLSDPAGANVYINEQLRGQTPYTINHLLPGSYAVRVEAQGFDPQSTVAEIQATGSRILEFQLVNNSGSIQLITKPALVKVFLDGRFRGISRPGEDSDALSQVLELKSLAPGPHILELSRRGYLTLRKQIMIEVGSVLNLREKLELPFIPDTIVRRGGGPEEGFSGVLKARYPSGDVELEVRPGVIVTIPGAEIEDIQTIDSDSPMD